MKRLEKSGYDMEKMRPILLLLASGMQLPAIYKNHTLQGEYAGYQECHLGFDWLLIYERLFEQGILYLYRTGSHDELFKK